MALKQLLITKRMESSRSKLEALRAKDAEFETRAASIKTREAEIEESANELADDATDEDRQVVEEAATQLEADQAALDTETESHEGEKKKLEDEIRDLQTELDEVNSRAKTPPVSHEPQPENRKDDTHMINRMRFWGNTTKEERSAMMAREDVKGFITRLREMKGTRSVTGAELAIPEVLLGVLRDNLHRYSKLISKVLVKPVKGKARAIVSGSIPEAIWMEAVSVLNELAISFTQVEVDGFMIGGFIPIPNATLEDSDINLASEAMDAIGQGMGLGIDKAILFGKGIKMPLGIATRLAQTSKPSDWPTNAPAWSDLHSANILKINPSGMTAEAFFAALLLDLGVADPAYAIGGTFWAMNRKTKMTLMSKCLSFNAAGALVAGQMGTMPIESGEIVELPCVADNDIIGGFGSLYLLAEREGATLAASEHVRFIEHQTVFKGVSRYDGMPVFGAGFVMVNIANADPTTTVLFPQDIANTVATPKALPVAGSYTGAQSVALTCATPDAKIYYTVDGSAPDATKTLYNGPIAVTATKTIKAIGIKTGMTDSTVLSATYTIL